MFNQGGSELTVTLFYICILGMFGDLHSIAIQKPLTVRNKIITHLSNLLDCAAVMAVNILHLCLFLVMALLLENFLLFV